MSESGVAHIIDEAAVQPAAPSASSGALAFEAPKATRGRKPKSAVEPKKPVAAVRFFVSHRLAQLKAAGGSTTLSSVEATKAFNKEWRKLSWAERAPFQEQARADYARYEEAMANYVTTGITAVARHMVTKLGRLKKDPRRPKHPHSAYFYYLETNRPAVMEKTPGMSVPNITRALAKGWRQLTEDEKRPYEGKAAADKERFSEELKTYEPSDAYAYAKEQYAEHKKAKASSASASSASAASASTATGASTSANFDGAVPSMGVDDATLEPAAHRPTGGGGAKLVAPPGEPSMADGSAASSSALGADGASALPLKRPRGRPKGSKNKPKPPPDDVLPPPPPLVGPDGLPLKRGRGRPKGSKNKPKPPAPPALPLAPSPDPAEPLLMLDDCAPGVGEGQIVVEAEPVATS